MQVKGTDASSGSGTNKTTTTTNKYTTKANTYGINSAKNVNPTTTTKTGTTSSATTTTTPVTTPVTTTKTTVATPSAEEQKKEQITIKNTSSGNSSSGSSGSSSSGSSVKKTTTRNTSGETKAEAQAPQVTAKSGNIATDPIAQLTNQILGNTASKYSPSYTQYTPATQKSAVVGSSVNNGTNGTLAKVATINNDGTKSNESWVNMQPITADEFNGTAKSGNIATENLKAPSGNLKEMLQIAQTNADNSEDEKDKTFWQGVTDFFKKNSEAYDRANEGDTAQSFLDTIIHSMGLDLFKDSDARNLAPNTSENYQAKQNAKNNEQDTSNNGGLYTKNKYEITPSLRNGSPDITVYPNQVPLGSNEYGDFLGKETSQNAFTDRLEQMLKDETPEDKLADKVLTDDKSDDKTDETAINDDTKQEADNIKQTLISEGLPETADDFAQSLWNIYQSEGVNGITDTLSQMGISYNDALVRAINQLTPQYQSNLKSKLNSLQTTALKSGFYGQLPAEALYEQAVASNESELQAAIFELAEEIYGNEYDRALETAELNNDIANDKFNNYAKLFSLLYPNYGKTTSTTTTSKTSGITTDGRAYDNGGLTQNTVKTIQQALGYSSSQSDGYWTDEMKTLTGGMDAATAYSTYVNAPTKTTAVVTKENWRGKTIADEETTVPQHISNLIAADPTGNTALEYLNANWNKIGVSDRQDIQSILIKSKLGFYSAF